MTNTGDAALDWSISEAEQVESGNSVQDVLYDNGPFVTHPGAGPGGSRPQCSPGCQPGYDSPWAVTSVPVGCPDGGRLHRRRRRLGCRADHVLRLPDRLVDRLAPSPGSTTRSGTVRRTSPVAPSSTVTPPPTGCSETSWTNAYRVSETTVDTTRPIMSIVAEGGFQLAEGTYWLDSQWTVTSPPGRGSRRSPSSARRTTGNGLQFFEGVWQTFLDSGTNTPQGSPFTIQGVPSAAEGCAAPTDITWLSVSPSAGVHGAGGE